MLAPDVRELLVENLRPPDGYTFDRGVGTTFSLDLLSLLVVPLALTAGDLTIERAIADPLLLFEGLGRQAGRLTLFCQAGRIAVPPRNNQLYSLLEEMVVEVASRRRGGVFHPKVWLLRYLPLSDEEPPMYRLLTQSRNLTFDRSWDLMVRLEGALDRDRTNAFGRNHPLGDFIKSLPRLACHPPATRTLDDIDLMQDEVRRVRWSEPSPFAQGALMFHPFSTGSRASFGFNAAHDRALIVSPFLSDGLLERATQSGGRHVLISRPDSIGALRSATRQRFESLYVFDEHAMSDVEDVPLEDVGPEEAGTRQEPSGLHAKLFILESGSTATWLVGSANATNAAFSSNVEFGIELQGHKSRVGIDAVLGGEDEQATLRSLLQPFAAEGVSEADRELEQAQTLAEQVQSWLVSLDMGLDVRHGDSDLYDLLLSFQLKNKPSGQYEVHCWPITLSDERALSFPSDGPEDQIQFSGMSLLGLTSFVAFRVTAHCGQRDHMISFVRNLPLVGVPDERQNAICRALIEDRQGFMRYLWLILMAEQDELLQGLDLAGGGGSPWWSPTGSGDAFPLFEALVRAVSQTPEKLERIAEIIQALQDSERTIMPEGFGGLWETLTDARGRLP